MAMKGRFRKIFLIFAFVFSTSLIISFQNCGNKLTNNNLGFFNANGQCPVSESPKINDQSLCIGIQNCESNFCSFGGDDIQANVSVNYRNDAKQQQCDNTLANLSLHSCNFGVSTETRITHFGLDRESSIISLSVNQAAIEEVENEDEEDVENYYNLRLISFYSLRCGSRNENSILTSGALHRAKLSNDGNVILSDYDGIICGSVSGTTLECTYNIPTGCSFGLTIWSYDSQNSFSASKTIQI